MNENISQKALAIALCPIYLFIALFFFFVIGLSNVDAKSFDSTLIRFFNSQGKELDRTNSNTLIHEGTVGYFLINYGFSGTIGSGSDVYIDLKPNVGFRYNPTISTLTGLQVTYSAVLSNGSTIDVSNYCNDSAHLTKIMYSSTDYGNEYRLTISCQFKSSASLNGFSIRLVPIMNSKSAITRSWYSIDNASYTNTPSDADKIINNQNQNTNDIINNQDKNTQDITDSIDKNTESLEDTNEYIKDDTPPNVDFSSLGNVSGLLPPGPLDTLLNIPFNFLSVVVSSLGGVCVPYSGTFVFDSTLTLPCFSEQIYDDVPDALMLFINLIPTSFLLIKYFKHLYKKVERATSLESTTDDEWGCI